MTSPAASDTASVPGQTRTRPPVAQRTALRSYRANALVDVACPALWHSPRVSHPERHVFEKWRCAAELLSTILGSATIVFTFPHTYRSSWRQQRSDSRTDWGTRSRTKRLSRLLLRCPRARALTTSRSRSSLGTFSCPGLQQKLTIQRWPAPHLLPEAQAHRLHPEDCSRWTTSRCALPHLLDEGQSGQRAGGDVYRRRGSVSFLASTTETDVQATWDSGSDQRRGLGARGRTRVRAEGPG